MVAASYDQKPYRRVMMETWNGEVYRSPSRYHGDAPLLCKLVKQALANLPEV